MSGSRDFTYFLRQDFFPFLRRWGYLKEPLAVASERSVAVCAFTRGGMARACELLRDLMPLFEEAFLVVPAWLRTEAKAAAEDVGFGLIVVGETGEELAVRPRPGARGRREGETEELVRFVAGSLTRLEGSLEELKVLVEALKAKVEALESSVHGRGRETEEGHVLPRTGEAPGREPAPVAQAPPAYGEGGATADDPSLPSFLRGNPWVEILSRRGRS
ncbi:MAG: hypothetical protein QXP81_01475 [Nitrososphaerota archaeon]